MAKSVRDKLVQLHSGALKNIDTAGSKLVQMEIIYEGCNQTYDDKYIEHLEMLQQLRLMLAQSHSLVENFKDYL